MGGGGGVAKREAGTLTGRKEKGRTPGVSLSRHQKTGNEERGEPRRKWVSWEEERGGGGDTQRDTESERELSPR